MAESIQEVKKWLDSLTQERIAIDDGGLALVELDENDEPTDAYYEIGGVPVKPCTQCGGNAVVNASSCSRCDGSGEEPEDDDEAE